MKIECPKCKRKTIGIIPICYRCDKKEYFKEYYIRKQDEFKDASKKRYWNNVEEERKKRKEYGKNHKKEAKKRTKAYETNQLKLDANFFENRKKKCKEYYNQNKKILLKKQYEYKKQRLKNNIEYAIKEKLSSRIRMAILNHNGKKNSSSIQLLGAPINVVRKHIESKFIEGMAWDNWGNKTSKRNGYKTYWEVDHFIPCEAFNLKDNAQQKICFHYTNLQPLWWGDNNKKSDIIPMGWDGFVGKLW